MKWIAQPIAIVRRRRRRRAAPEGAEPSAIRPDGLLGHERDVGILERGLAGRDAPERDTLKPPEDLLRGLLPDGGLDDDDLGLVLVLDRDRRDAVDGTERLDRAVLDPYTSTSTTTPSDTCPSGRAASPRRRFAPRDDRDPVAERVRLEHVVRRQEHRLAGRLEVAIVARSSRAPTGSTPIVGSSRKSTGGSCSRPRAMCRRWRMPRE